MLTHRMTFNLQPLLQSITDIGSDIQHSFLKEQEQVRAWMGCEENGFSGQLGKPTVNKYLRLKGFFIWKNLNVILIHS